MRRAPRDSVAASREGLLGVFQTIWPVRPWRKAFREHRCLPVISPERDRPQARFAHQAIGVHQSAGRREARTLR